MSTEKQKNTRVCSDHFVSGTPAALYETRNTDWAPSLGLGHEKCKVAASSSFDRYERALKRKRQRLDDDQSRHYSVLLQNKKEYLGEQQNSVEPVCKDVSCQTEFTCDDLCHLEEQYRLKSAKLSKLSFSEESMKCDDKKTSTYTGLPNFVTLAAVFNLVEPYMPSSQCNVFHDFADQTKADFISRRFSIQIWCFKINSIKDDSTNAGHSCCTPFIPNQVARKRRTKKDNAYFI